MTHKETQLVTLGTPHNVKSCDVVNVPVHRASTVLLHTLADLRAAESGDYKGYTYARFETPSSAALAQTMAALSGSQHAIITSSGLSAIVVALTAFLRSGDHLLMADAIYGPTRHFCDGILAKFGVETTYYDPLIGGDITKLMKPNTRVVFVESPGSQTFEVQDIPAIARVAHAKGAVVIGDLTWGTPLYMKPFDWGVDVVIQSLTKYVGGHSDLVMGALMFNDAHAEAVRDAYLETGACNTADNCYLALRGLRTLSVRVKQQFENAMAVAKWLKNRSEIEEVLFPPLPGSPGHDIWKRDFTGGSSLFGLALAPVSQEKLAAFIDGLAHFGRGFSWGGFESLVVAPDLSQSRKARPWPYPGPNVRLHIGLEHPDDLIRDLEAGLKRMNT